VSLKDSLDGCERILRDEFKDYPESALYMIGAIAEAKKPETKQPEAKKPGTKQTETTKPNEGKREIAKTDPQPEATTASSHEP
jgi:F-type H+-transporting ATPase subunit beta